MAFESKKRRKKISCAGSIPVDLLINNCSGEVSKFGKVNVRNRGVPHFSPVCGGQTIRNKPI